MATLTVDANMTLTISGDYLAMQGEESTIVCAIDSDVARAYTPVLLYCISPSGKIWGDSQASSTSVTFELSSNSFLSEDGVAELYLGFIGDELFYTNHVKCRILSSILPSTGIEDEGEEGEVN